MFLENSHLVTHPSVDAIVPLTVIEPVPEAMEAILNQVFCSPEVKPRID